MCVVCSSASDLLLPRAFDVSAVGSSPGDTRTGSSGSLTGLTTALEGGVEGAGCKDFDDKIWL